MKRIVLLCSLALLVPCFTPAVQAAANPIRIDVLYMNHGPLQQTLKDMKTIFSGYGSRLAVTWHDYDSPDGEKFMANKGIKGHTPLVIWIDDKQTCMVGTKQVTFAGFPSGSGPAFFQGKWTMDDLKGALNQATAMK